MRMTVLLLAIGITCTAFGQSHHEGHGTSSDVPKPRVFLDKNPRIVEYQLKRLSNAQLLLVDRATDESKYAPVYAAILVRPGMSPDHRESALAGLQTIRGTSAIEELLAATAKLDLGDANEGPVVQQLLSILLGQPASLRESRERLLAAVDLTSPSARVAGFAGLITLGELTPAWNLASHGDERRLSYLQAVVHLPDTQLRSDVRPRVLECLSPSNSIPVRLAAITALASIPTSAGDSFERLAPLLGEDQLRATAVRALLKIPKQDWPKDRILNVLQGLVTRVESLPAAERTTDDELDGLQLTEDLLALIPVSEATPLRRRLREVTVRIVQVGTVHEEMRYDKAYFVVEAGRPVEVVLKNDDAMPHNLVITNNGQLRDIALLAEGMGNTPGRDGKLYLPLSDEVLFATGMVQPGQSERLVFEAPATPGEYPYVCTFPRHWMRMYGVMVVVEDLEMWLANPSEPADPLGNTRAFVRNWNVSDFSDVEKGLRGRNAEIGSRLFKEATCAQCHKVRGVGGAVGPELTDVAERWKGDHRAVLREILEPSYKIEPKFAVQTVITDRGEILSGIVTAQDNKSVTLITNPENPQPIVVSRAEIDEIVQSTSSLMPKGLLDRFTRDEIFELLAFVCGTNGNPTR